uniref:Uncharacterized protein n=1 Tax=Clandestinovirus TaxID=2831644 RepID=A0A8F8PK03_9VIRU|nr:hypothetical protein KOM_12_234 [Clandestinovirus]
MTSLTTARLYKSLLYHVNTHANSNFFKRKPDGSQLYCMVYNSSESNLLGTPVDIHDKTRQFDEVQFVTVPVHFPLYLEQQVLKLDDFESVKTWIEELYYRNPDASVTINNNVIDNYDIEKFPLLHLFE